MVVTITIAITITTSWVAVRITITAATIIKRALRTLTPTLLVPIYKMRQWNLSGSRISQSKFSLASCLNQLSWPRLRFPQDGRERGPCELTLEKNIFSPGPWILWAELSFPKGPQPSLSCSGPICPFLFWWPPLVGPAKLWVGRGGIPRVYETLCNSYFKHSQPSIFLLSVLANRLLTMIYFNPQINIVGAFSVIGKHIQSRPMYLSLAAGHRQAGHSPSSCFISYCKQGSFLWSV